MAKLPKFRMDEPCMACPMGEEGCTRLATRGTSQAKILIVTSIPHDDNAAYYKEHFPEKAMKVFKRAMSQNGFGNKDFVFHSAIKCHFKRDERPTQEKTQISEHCREFLLRVIDKMKPEVIVPLGVDATKQVYGRAKKITKVRGICEWDKELNAYIFPMIDPIMVAMYPQNQGVFQADARSLSRLIANDYDQELVQQEGLGEYEEVEDLQFLVDEEPDEVIFDTETEGLRWAYEDKRLLTMQFCVSPGRAYLVSWDHPDNPAGRRKKARIRRQVEQLLCRPDVTVAGHNLKYDVLWLLAKLGIRIRIGDDTLMLAAIHDENNMNKDLSTLVKMHVREMAGYDDLFNATYDKAHMEDVPLAKIVEYGCGDVDATCRLLYFLRGQINHDNGLIEHYENVSLPGLNAFASIEPRGLIVHEDRLHDLQDEVYDHVEALRISLIQQIPRAIKREHIENKKEIKLSRGDLLRDVLFEHSAGFSLRPRIFTKTTKNLKPEFRVPSTSSKDHLPFFFEDCPFTEELAEWMKVNRLLGTNIQKFEENYMIGDMVYPSYQLHVAVTGRTSSQDPNGQNFPKRGRFAKAYRDIFIPPPGYVMLEADLSQAELRIAADMANDQVMIRIYNEIGGDIHKTTALIVAGLTMEEFLELTKADQSMLRFKAKAVNFGFIYGMGWRNFIVYAKTQYGVEFTSAEAERIRDQFFARYPRLVAWHRGMREFAREHGFVRSYSGRIRHLPMIYSSEDYIRHEAERQAINSPVQEFASTLGVMALSEIDQNVNPEYLSVTGFVHDAIYALAPLEYAEWAAKTLKQYMESVDIEEKFGRVLAVPMIADVSLGISGGAQYEMQNLRLNRPYDWNDLDLPEDMNEIPFDLPEQLVPPENGRIELPEYLKAA